METERVESYDEISVVVRPEEVDLVAGYIVEHIGGGVVLDDSKIVGRTRVTCYVAVDDGAPWALTGLKNYLAAMNPEYTGMALERRCIRNRDWIEAYRRSVEPLLIGETIAVKPPWSTESFPARVELIIEPKMAFGTGRHETTRSALMELEQTDLAGKSVLDLGSGSGILSILAARRGAVAVVASDTDPEAVENSRENFMVNGVDAVCRAKQGSIDDLPAGRRFDVIVVNIVKAVILPMLGRLKERLNPGGVMILAGFLDLEENEVAGALKQHDLTSFTVRTDNVWITFTIQRP
jgi:ribosomal protein L11 methyltransferase